MWMPIGRVRDPPVVESPLEYMMRRSRDIRGALTKQVF